MDKIEAIELLQKEYHYSEILVEDEFIKQPDGITVRNKIYDIADAFSIELPVITFQPDTNDPKGPMPNHTEECITNEHWNSKTPCACWEISYTGIAVMDVVDRIAQLYNISSGKYGRGSAQREKLTLLHRMVEDIVLIEPKYDPEELVDVKTGITIDLSKDWVEIPLED